MTDDEHVRKVSRRLRDVVEPIAANVYFAPEAQSAYQELGLSYGPGYFCSRSACMGQLPGEVVAAAFGVFNPALVVPSVEEGWSKTDAATILEVRQRGATESLRRLLGDEPDGLADATAILRRAGEAARGEGRPIFSGLQAQGWPGDPMGDLWRAADLVREHRGDSHTAAWVGAGLDPVEIGLLTELWWRLPLNSYIRTRGWSDEQIDAGLGRLRDRGLLDGEAFTPAGEALRGEIEEATDRQERPIVEALGDDADRLFELLGPWSKAIVDAGGYPRDPSQLTRR